MTEPRVAVDDPSPAPLSPARRLVARLARRPRVGWPSWPLRVRTSSQGPRPPRRPTPTPVLLVSTSLCVLAALALSFVAEVTFLGTLTHNRDQITQLDAFRSDLANAVAPVGPLDDKGVELAAGTPVAIVEIPSLHLREVVGEGTSASVTMAGPGHRRDSALPGQAGVSVIFGRSSAFGAPFRGIASLPPGSTVRVVTGQGTSQFRVTSVRHAGDPLPTPLPTGASRLILVTADGPRFEPTGVVLVDATATTKSFATGPQLAASALEAPERLMAGDTSTTNLFPLVLWSQLLLALSAVLVWTAMRWGRWQTWLVGVPSVLAVGLAVIDHLCQTLPNLL